MRVCVVKRMKIDVPVQSIRERLSLLDIKKQNRDLYDYINELPVTTDESTIDGVVLVTHPLDDENGKPDSFERIAIVCIGVEYTIYKKTQGVGEEEDNGSRLLRRGERRLRRTRHSYWNAQKTVAAAPYTYYNNKHDILNELTYKCNARFPCSKCSRKTDTKCIPCGNAYICVRCHTHTELAGDDIKTFKQSLVLRLDELTAVKKTAYLQKRGTRFLFEQRTERIRGGGTTRGITLGRASHRSHRDGRGCLNKSLLILFRNEIVLFFFFSGAGRRRISSSSVPLATS